MTSGCRETETDSAAAPDDEATTEDEEDGPAEAAEDELAAEGAEGPAEGAVASSTSMMKLFGYPERVGSGLRDSQNCPNSQEFRKYRNQCCCL